MRPASLVALAIAVSASPAFAQPSDQAAAADLALDEGRRLYDLQEWDQAIAKFKEAYRLRANAAALYNIAQAYRLQGDCAQAAMFYKTFKRNFPNEKNVDAFIADMEECAKTQPSRPEPPDPVSPDPVSPDPVSPDPVSPDPVSPAPMPQAASSSPGRGMRIGGLATAGGGVVALGVGIGFGLRARSYASDAEDLAPGATWDPTLETRGEDAQRASRVLLIGGGAALLAGGALYLLGRAPSTERETLTVVPTSDGASVAWSGRF